MEAVKAKNSWGAYKGAVLSVVGLALGGCGGGSGSGSSGVNTATCLGNAANVAVYVQFDQGDKSYTEGFDSGLTGCEQQVQTGLPGGIALSQVNSLYVVGNVSGGATQFRVFNNLSARGNTSLDLGQDYVMPMTGMEQPEGLLYAGFGASGSLSVTADAVAGAAASSPALHASFLKATGSSVEGEYVKVMQSVTGGPVWNMAYDSADDRLFAASTGGVVTVFDNFQAQVVAGKSPDASRTITPGTIDGNGHATQVSGALHGLAYDPASDTLVIVDFDNAALYVVSHAGSADDSSSAGGGPRIVVPDRVVSGSETGLVAPTDAGLAADGSLYVVDQGGKGAVLRYENFLAGTSSTPIPDAVGAGRGGVPAFLAVVAPAN